MYLLERGRVKLIRESKDRRVQLLSIHAHGELLGEIPVFDRPAAPYRHGRGDDPRHARGMAGA